MMHLFLQHSQEIRWADGTKTYSIAATNCLTIEVGGKLRLDEVDPGLLKPPSSSEGITSRT
jgi:hypothetical protein